MYGAPGAVWPILSVAFVAWGNLFLVYSSAIYLRFICKIEGSGFLIDYYLSHGISLAECQSRCLGDIVQERGETHIARWIAAGALILGNKRIDANLYPGIRIAAIHDQWSAGVAAARGHCAARIALGAQCRCQHHIRAKDREALVVGDHLHLGIEQLLRKVQVLIVDQAKAGDGRLRAHIVVAGLLAAHQLDGLNCAREDQLLWQLHQRHIVVHLVIVIGMHEQLCGRHIYRFFRIQLNAAKDQIERAPAVRTVARGQDPAVRYDRAAAQQIIPFIALQYHLPWKLPGCRTLAANNASLLWIKRFECGFSVGHSLRALGFRYLQYPLVRQAELLAPVGATAASQCL